MIPTKHGYRVRCLRCGTIGPERKDPARAWAALRDWRSSKSRTTRDQDDRHEEEDAPDLRAGPPEEATSSEA
ncbi:MAG: hypothetical protein H0T57_06380 [Rubrobacter sp.]|nr:hypothetical protein [Rubrobacter sp.]